MYSFTGNEYIERAVENYSNAMLNVASFRPISNYTQNP